MKRICVVGCSGAGKSTFARRCAEHGYARLELDAIVHQANWTTLPDDEARIRIQTFIDEHERWVIDGNYPHFRHLLWRRADTIVWLDPDRWVVMTAIVRRSLRRLVRREELWNGNRERWSYVLSLNPERSIVAWAWTRFARYREEYGRQMRGSEWPHLRWVRLGSRDEAEGLLDSLRRSTGRPSSRTPA